MNTFDARSSWGNLANVCAALGEHQDADCHFRKGLSVGLDEPYLYTRYGLFLKRTGHLARARRYFRRAVRLDPDQKDARRALLELEDPPSKS